METRSERNGASLVFYIRGVLDTQAAPDLEAELIPALEGVTDLTLDVSEMSYILSAGICVIMKAGKTIMKQKGSMKVRGANDSVKDIFRTTGLTRIFIMTDF
ncbi:MAG: STAS domain-containing protein [Lachnospiraceae bacterium]|nr:STAS domain-containing protein [Lachnospiraceae bacterium]